jgi:hypothetical protein
VKIGKLVFWNTAHEATHSYLKQIASDPLVIGGIFQEVYDCHPRRGSSNRQELKDIFSGFEEYFSEENSVGAQEDEFLYGQTMFIRKCRHVKTVMVTQNSPFIEDFHRPTQAATIEYYGQMFVFGGLHGKSSLGKKEKPRNPRRDELQRQQNAFINKELQKHADHGVKRIIFGGDLNYSRALPGLEDLRRQTVFGPEGGEILNQRFNKWDTRTKERRENKSQEADIVVVSEEMKAHIQLFEVDNDAPESDHGLQTVTFAI